MDLGSLGIVLALLAGCVGKGRLELAEVQLDATRTALSARQAACQEQLQELTERLEERQAQLSDAAGQNEDLLHRLEALEAELAVLREEQARWVADGQANADPSEEPVEIVPDPTRWATALARLSHQDLEKQRVRRHHAEVVAAFQPLVEAGRLEVVEDGPHAVVRIPHTALFQEGRMLLSPLGEAVLDQVSAALRGLPRRTLRIDGHTDHQPHFSVQHPSNWELGFAGAMLVLRTLQEHDPTLSATAASFADTTPLMDPSAPDASRRNARVEIVIAPPPPPSRVLAPADEVHPVDEPP